MRTKYAKTPYRLSPIYESLTDAEGNGLVGFTIQYSEERIENHVRFFTPKTHDEIRRQSEMEYQSFATSEQKKHKNVSDKERRTS